MFAARFFLEMQPKRTPVPGWVPGQRMASVDGSLKVHLFGDHELAIGQLREAMVDGISLVIARKSDGTLRALRNRFAHHGALLSKGRVRPLVSGPRNRCVRAVGRPRCPRGPWHGYKFDLDTGRSLASPSTVRARCYEVLVEQHRVMLVRSGGHDNRRPRAEVKNERRATLT
jgi:nitrite reductase/ring-hydroxylating ferredoxin subunit